MFTSSKEVIYSDIYSVRMLELGAESFWCAVELGFGFIAGLFDSVQNWLQIFLSVWDYAFLIRMVLGLSIAEYLERFLCIMAVLLAFQTVKDSDSQSFCNKGH